jgi:phospholipid N-methyltransferase
MNPAPQPLPDNLPGDGTPPRRGPDWWLFFTKFLRHGTAIAACLPSSTWLARALVGQLDFSQARCVVELGAGTGPITAELLRRQRDGRSLVVERDPDFCRRLRQRFPQADVAQADALDLEKLLAERGMGQIDYCLSGLPLPSFAAADRDRVLEVVARRLAPGGLFLQLTHMPWVYYPLYRRYFPQVRFHLVLRNFPPAGFYVCQS